MYNRVCSSTSSSITSSRTQMCAQAKQIDENMYNILEDERSAIGLDDTKNFDQQMKLMHELNKKYRNSKERAALEF